MRAVADVGGATRPAMFQSRVGRHGLFAVHSAEGGRFAYTVYRDYCMSKTEATRGRRDCLVSHPVCKLRHTSSAPEHTRYTSIVHDYGAMLNTCIANRAFIACPFILSFTAAGL